MTLEDQLLARVEPEPNSGCWIWIGARHHFGHGSIRREQRSRRAHRVSWEIYRGEIAVGLCVLHKCDNPPCVNPDHLYLGTHLDNARDRESRRRRSMPRGEKHPRAKLTRDDVLDIRRRVAAGEIQRVIGQDYGLTQARVSEVALRHSWAWLP